MTKRTPIFIILLLSFIFISGCIVRSLNPLYTEKDIIFDPELLGIWGDPNDEKIKWEFTRSNKNAYKLVHTDEQGDKAEFEVHLVKLGSHKFLDIYLTSLGGDELAGKLNNFGLLHLWPMHSFMLVESIGDELVLKYFSVNWLKDKLEDDPKAVQHVRVGKKPDESYLLTAPPEELQSFILENVDDAFESKLVLKKMNKKSQDDK